MRKLARQAGLSVTTLYNLLGSREEILQALIQDSVQRLEAPAADAGAARNPLLRASRAMEGILRYTVENGDLLRPLIVADFRTGSWTRLGQQAEGEHFRSSKEAIRAAITVAQADGQLRKVGRPEVLRGAALSGLGARARPVGIRRSRRRCLSAQESGRLLHGPAGLRGAACPPRHREGASSSRTRTLLADTAPQARRVAGSDRRCRPLASACSWPPSAAAGLLARIRARPRSGAPVPLHPPTRTPPAHTASTAAARRSRSR